MNHHIFNRFFLITVITFFCSVAAKPDSLPDSNNIAEGSSNLAQGNIGQDINAVNKKSAKAFSKAQQDAQDAAGLLAPSSPLDPNDIKMERKIDEDAVNNKHHYHQNKKLLNQDQQQADQDIDNAKQQRAAARLAKEEAYQQKELLTNNDKQSKSDLATALTDFNNALPGADKVASCNADLNAQLTLLKSDTLLPLEDALSKQANDPKSATSAKRALKDQKRVDKSYQSVNSSLDTQIAAVDATINAFANKNELDQLILRNDALVQQVNTDSNQLDQDEQAITANTDPKQANSLQNKYDADKAIRMDDSAVANKYFQDSAANNSDFAEYDEIVNKKRRFTKSKNKIDETVTSVEGTDIHDKEETLKQNREYHKVAHQEKKENLATAESDYQTKKSDYLAAKDAEVAAKQEATDVAAAMTPLKKSYQDSKKQFADATDSYNQWLEKYNTSFNNNNAALQAGVDGLNNQIASNTANATNHTDSVEIKSQQAYNKVQQERVAEAGLLDDSRPLDVDDIKQGQTIDKNAHQEKQAYHQGEKILNEDQQQAAQDLQQAQAALDAAIAARAPIHKVEKSLAKEDKKAQQDVAAAEDALNVATTQNSSDISKDQKKLQHATSKEQEIAREKSVVKADDVQAKKVVTNAQAAVGAATTAEQNIQSAKQTLVDTHHESKAETSNAKQSYNQWLEKYNTSFNNNNAALQAGVDGLNNQIASNTANATNHTDSVEIKSQQAYNKVQQERVAEAGLLDDSRPLDVDDIKQGQTIDKNAHQEKQAYHQGEKILNEDQQQAAQDLQQAQAALDAAIAARAPIHKVEKSLAKEDKKAQQDVAAAEDALNVATTQNSSDISKDQKKLQHATSKEQEIAREKSVVKADDVQAKKVVTNAQAAVGAATTAEQNIQSAKQTLVDTHHESKAETSNAKQSYNQWLSKLSDVFASSIGTLQTGIDGMTTSINDHAANLATNASSVNKKGRSSVDKMERLANKIDAFFIRNPSFNSQDVDAMDKAIAKNNFRAKKEFYQGGKLAQQDQEQVAQDVQQAQLNLDHVRTTLDPIHQVAVSLKKEDQHAKKKIAAAEQNIVSPASTEKEISAVSISSDKNQKKLDHAIAKEQRIANEEAIAKEYDRQAKVAVKNAKATLDTANAEMQAANNEKSSVKEKKAQLKLVRANVNQNINDHIENNGIYYDEKDKTLYYRFHNKDDAPILFAKRNAHIAGRLVTTFANGTPQFGEQYAMISAPNVNGSFDNIVMTQGMRGRMILVGDPIVALEIAPQSYTQVAVNPNQYNVARALDSYIPATHGDELTVSAALDSLTANQYQAAFNQIMPALYSSFATIAFNIENAQNNQWIQNLGGIRVGGTGFSQQGFKDSPLLNDDKQEASGKKDILIPSADNHWRTFAQGNGVFATVDNNNQLPGYSSESGGITLGADYNWSDNFSTGVYTGYQGMQSKQSGGNFICDNSSRFGLFSTYQQGGWFANAVLGGDTHSYQVNRTIQFADISRTASSAPTAGELNSMLATGYDVKKGNFTFGPVSSLQYTYFGLQPFTETGAQSLDLAVGNVNANSLIYTLGTHIFYTWQMSKDTLLIPQINLSWQHEFLQNPYAINATLPNGANFTYMTATAFRDSLYTGIGVTMEIAKKYDASFFYNAAAGNPSLMSQNIFVSLGMKF